MTQKWSENILSNFKYIDQESYSYIGFVNNDDKPSGYGIYIDNERCLIFEGVFSNGTKNGLYYQYDISYNLSKINSETFKLVQYQDDQFIRYEQYYYCNYPLQSDKQCYIGKVNNNGNVQGLCKIVYRNQKVLTGLFSDGKINGLAITFQQQNQQFQIDYYQNDQKIYQIAKYNNLWKQYYIQSKYEHNQFVERCWQASELSFRYIGRINFLDQANGFGILQINNNETQKSTIVIGKFQKHQMHGYYHVITDTQEYKVMEIECQAIENIQQQNMIEQKTNTRQLFQELQIINQIVKYNELSLQCTIQNDNMILTTVKNDDLIAGEFQITLNKQNLIENKLTFILEQFNEKQFPEIICQLNINNIYIYNYDSKQQLVQITNDDKILYRGQNYIYNKQKQKYIEINRDMSMSTTFQNFLSRK